MTGYQKELSVAKDKTRKQMRTRLKNKCCIGLPVPERAVKRGRNKKVARLRADPETQQIVSWFIFSTAAQYSMTDDLVGLGHTHIVPGTRGCGRHRGWPLQSPHQQRYALH